MLILDFNQTMIANIAVHLSQNPGEQIDLPTVRRMVLRTIRAHRNRFNTWGELVIAADSDKYWRKGVFEHYKAKRPAQAAKAGRNMQDFHNCINTIRDEIRDNFPYRVICVEGAEADDVIASLVSWYADFDSIMIVSADHDFIQLQKHENVKQYDPIRKHMITHDDPHAYLCEHILRGDPGDGVPNILSPADCFVTGVRQTPMTSKKLLDYMSTLIFSDTVLARYEQNKQLIDLKKIPKELDEQIIFSFAEQVNKRSDRVMPYMIKNNLGSLMQSINDFI